MSSTSQYKILFLAPYPVGCAPSQRFKYEQYYPLFEEHGFSITTSSFVNNSFWKIIYEQGFILKKIGYTLIGYVRRLWDLFRLRSFDIVYIHLWVTPLGAPIFEWLVKLIAKKIIYDLDDMIYLGHSSEANKSFTGLKGKKKVPFLIKHANHVVVSSPELFEFASSFNNMTTDITSTVDTDRFVPVDRTHNKGPIILGWTGTHSTSRYLHLLDGVLIKLAAEIDFKLVVVGDERFTNENFPIEHREWTAETEVAALQDIDIGLYPLPFEQWIMGKSGLKAITYMALEIPCVASAIGANERVVVDGKTGYLVKTEEEWYEKIKLLTYNPHLRRMLGREGRKVAVEKFSIKANVGKYLSVLNCVLSKDSP